MNKLTYKESEAIEDRKHINLQRYIKRWSERQSTKKISNEPVKKADIQAYINEAKRYFEIKDRIECAKDITERHILSYKMRVIESKFEGIMSYDEKIKLKH